MIETAVVTKPVKRVCPPATTGSPLLCGERASRGPHDAPPFQSFPTGEGILFKYDRRNGDLKDDIGGRPGKVRSYKMKSVFKDDATVPDERVRFQQRGSGPNFQGGWLTLCTCMHPIRAEREPREWEADWWWAGFTSIQRFDRIWLFYLAQVKSAYPSAACLWAALSEHVRQAKTTQRNPLGDAFEPLSSSGDYSDDAYFMAASYHPPMLSHSHHQTTSDDRWKKDIEFFHRGFKRNSVYLVAKPELTFLWTKPTLYLEEHPRHRTWDSVDELLGRLKAA